MTGVRVVLSKAQAPNGHVGLDDDENAGRICTTLAIESRVGNPAVERLGTPWALFPLCCNGGP